VVEYLPESGYDRPAYTKEKRATMIFNTECKVENDLHPDPEERKVWEGIF
jgi:carboxylesterase type B